jgi:hypothetical protein
MTNITESAKISTITNILFKNGNTPMDSLIMASALVSKEFLLTGKYSTPDLVKENIDDAVHSAILTIDGVEHTGAHISTVWQSLVNANLVTEEGTPGTMLMMLSEDAAKTYPTPSGEELVRKRQYIGGNPNHLSKCAKDAIHALQRTEYRVDTSIYRLACAVYENAVCEEQYVLDGCAKMIQEGNVPVVSEFFADLRGRLYQGDFYGPNGQSSDMARALMDLHGVPTDYDIEKAKYVIRHEMEDMADDVDATMAVLMDIGQREFIKQEICSKPWSFIKAAMILIKLERGERPYIGMAFGLDAKCSGPQLGALMTGDADIAEACGFSFGKALHDAYELAINALEKEGVTGFTRDLMKKPYMGIFYGQAWLAFADVDNFGTGAKQHKPELLEAIRSMPVDVHSAEGGYTLEETILRTQARKFHGIVEGSFGKMSALRQRIKDAHVKWEDGVPSVLTSKPTKHTMPDGFVVAMDYRVKVDIMNEVVEFGNITRDVRVIAGDVDAQFNGMTFRTKEFNLYDYGRTGFVNMIQATDALIARLIVTKLDQIEGAQHIVSVHDCFRVNICDMIDGKLHRAIQGAYMDLFSTEHNEKRGYIRNQDIIGGYFKGVRDAGANPAAFSQFELKVSTGKYTRNLHKTGFPIEAMIKDLECTMSGTGSTYYFAK